ncbi:L-cystine transporter, partial [Staphylococcus aureus]
MNAFLTLINIIVLVIFIVILHMMARKHISFAKRVFTALGIGIVFGVLLHLIYG